MQIAVVGEPDVEDLLPLIALLRLLRVAPGDDALLDVARTLVADPEGEGFQLIARDDAGRAVGFATVYWSWSTLAAARTAIMNDLFVHPDARGQAWPRTWSRVPAAIRPPWRRLDGLADREGQLSGPAALRTPRRHRAEWIDYSLDTTSSGPHEAPVELRPVIYAFDDCELDLRRYELRRGGADAGSSHRCSTCSSFSCGSGIAWSRRRRSSTRCGGTAS